MGLAKIAAVTTLGFLLGFLANLHLFVAWYEWSQGPFGDCPDFAFRAYWYPEPPPLVIFIPIILSLPGAVLFIRQIVTTGREKSSLLTLASLAGLFLNCIPWNVALVTPLISELLHLSRPGC